MQAEDIHMVREHLARCAAEQQKNKELLQHLVGVECSPCPRGWGLAHLSPPFPTQEKKQQELQVISQELTLEVSVPSSAHVPRLQWVWLCHGLRACLQLLFPARCSGAEFQGHPLGPPAAGGMGGPVEGEFTE